jgi:hypothetical protein
MGRTRASIAATAYAKVPHRGGGRFVATVQRRFVGDKVTLKILRNREEMEVGSCPRAC